MRFECPICHKVLESPFDEEKSTRGKYFPFCSERCRLIDLGAWLDAEYKIGESESDSSDDDSAVQ